VGASGFLSVSAPPPGRGGEGGVVDEKILPPTVSKPMPHGLPCSLHPCRGSCLVARWLGPGFSHFSHTRTRTVVSPLRAAVT